MAEEKKYRYQTEIQQMMYVFGEVQDALPEVTMLVEEIVQRHTMEMIAKSVAVARRRVNRGITVDDVVFLIRHDRAKVNRLKDYLSWKDLRKNVREDSTLDNDLDDDAPETSGKTKKRVKFTWEYVKEFTDYLDDESDDEDEDDIEAYRDSLIRLKAADDITRNMSQSEYMFYSDCKTASFTHRKGKRFREWTCMSRYFDGKPNDDIIDVVGFLCYELVRKLTETALQVKKETTDVMITKSLRQAAHQAQLERLKAIEAEKAAKMRRGIQPTQTVDPEPIPMISLADLFESNEETKKTAVEGVDADSSSESESILSVTQPTKKGKDANSDKKLLKHPSTPNKKSMTPKTERKGGGEIKKSSSLIKKHDLSQDPIPSTTLSNPSSPTPLTVSTTPPSISNGLDLSMLRSPASLTNLSLTSPITNRASLSMKRTPLLASHIHEAYRRLQLMNCHTKLFRRGTPHVNPRLF